MSLTKGTLYKTGEISIQVYRDDTTIIFAWKKESDGKGKNYLPQHRKVLNISIKPLQLILKKRT